MSKIGKIDSRRIERADRAEVVVEDRHTCLSRE